MAWTSMHFAIGMGATGVIGATSVLAWGLIRGRFPATAARCLPLLMTLGGFWAIVPDMPRLFREDFPSLGLAETLGAKTFERSLHASGDWFFWHARLDAQPQEFALAGILLMILLYNLAIVWLLVSKPGSGLRPNRNLHPRHKLHNQHAPGLPPIPTVHKPSNTKNRRESYPPLGQADPRVRSD